MVTQKDAETNFMAPGDVLYPLCSSVRFTSGSDVFASIQHRSCEHKSSRQKLERNENTVHYSHSWVYYVVILCCSYNEVAKKKKKKVK